MFSYRDEVDRAHRSAPVLPIDDHTKIVIMSDCHRGRGNHADDFGENQHVCLAALRAYNRQAYTYIELGDGDELWENRRMADIKEVHGDVFEIFTQFYRAQRLWMLYGNHDMEKKRSPALFDTWYDVLTDRHRPLFPGAVAHESLLLRYAPAGRDYFLLHGHQVDFLNNKLWRLARFLVRHVWQRLEIFGVSDPTSAAKNHKVKRVTEKRLMRWAGERGMPVVAGHTHRPVFPEPGEGMYFNCGSCTHPWGIVAIEIAFGCISLVKWSQKARDDGAVYIGRDVIAGPRRLADYFAD